MHLAILITTIAAVVGVRADSAQAQTTYIWLPGQGLWIDPASWSPGGGPPTGTDIALFSNATSGTDLIKWDSSIGDQQVGELHFTNGNYTFDNLENVKHRLVIRGSSPDAFRVVGAGQIITNNGLNFFVANSNAYIGDDATLNLGTGSGGVIGQLNVDSSYLAVDGTINVDGGIISNTQGYIGYTNGSLGTVNINGSNSQWINSDDLSIGYQYIGRMNVTGGGQVSNVDGHVGHFSGGYATVTGGTSVWTNTGNLTVGRSAFGDLEILDGGTVISEWGILASTLNVSANVLVSGNGSSWTTNNNLVVGSISTGNLTIEDKGTVNSLNGILGRTHPDSIGNVTINGSGSQWNVSDTITVGGRGTGNLLIENEGQANSLNGSIGYDFNNTTVGIGNVTVTDANSQWNIDNDLRIGERFTGNVAIQNNGAINVGNGLYLGGDASAAGGMGTLDLESGGSMNVEGMTRLWSGGTINLVSGGSGGMLKTNSFRNTDGGTFNFHNGTFNLDGPGGTFDPGTSSFTVDGLASGDQPTFMLTNNADIFIGNQLTIGSNNFARLNVESGSRLFNLNAYLGKNVDSVGDANITGPGTEWINSGSLVVGHEGTATLSIADGAYVENNGGSIASTAQSSFSSVSVSNIGNSGLAGTWKNFGSLYVGGSASGQGGFGALNIDDANLIVTGTTKLYSSSIFALRGGMVETGSFDNSDQGNFTFTDGTLNVNGSNGFFDPGTTGYTINGTLSNDNPTLQLSNGASANFSDDINVGSTKTGTLLIDSGSQLTNENGFVGRIATGTGTATVNGEFSTWTNNSDLTIGRSGNGTLNVENGGTVNSFNGYVGEADNSIGTVNINGENSNLSVTESLIVGSNGHGTLTVQDKGQLNSYLGAVGDSDTGLGTVTIAGMDSAWNNTDDIYLGVSGTGTLNVESGGNVSVGDNAVLGYFADANGTLNVSGENSKLSIANDLFVARDGTGTMIISGKGTVESDSGFVGQLSNSIGTATVTGDQSNWTINDSLVVGFVGNGTLNIEDGGDVSSLYANIGLAGGQATTTITGMNSSLNVGEYLNVGGSNTSTLNIFDKATVTSNEGNVGQGNGISTVNISDTGSNWAIDQTLNVSSSGTATINVENGGALRSQSSYVGRGINDSGTVNVRDNGSIWETGGLVVGDLGGNGTLNIETGGRVESTGGIIAPVNNTTGLVNVVGANATWDIDGNLMVGPHSTFVSSATLNIDAGGLVSVSGMTSIKPTANVNLTGGRFEFGQTTLEDFSVINASSGSMAGLINHAGFTDVSTLTAFQNNNVDLTDVDFSNSGTLHGTATNIGTSVSNQARGEIFLTDGDFMRFVGDGDNAGEINNFGGVIRFSGTLINQAGALVAGRGQFVADGGWTNEGVMAFSGGPTEILGDLTLSGDGQIVTSGESTTTFYDDIIHNGSEIRTSQGSNNVFFGEFSGAGNFAGIGNVFFEGDLRPGNSPATVLFEGNVILGNNSVTHAELFGLDPSDYDRMLIGGDLSINGALAVSLGDHMLGANQEYLIAEIDGSLIGQFSGLGEGDLVGNFTGHDLFISYTAGDGNDIALFTAIPEPGSFTLVCLIFSNLITRRRRNSKA